MRTKEAAPKDAAAVVLIEEETGAVYLARRNPKIKFLGGYYAFPGGKVDADDARIPVANCANGDLARFIVCAARETFEEIGVLLTRGGDKMTKGQRASLHDDLTSGRFSFAEILENWNLRIDAEDFLYTGFWTTPSFSPVRFKTAFFAARCPYRQTPRTFGEFVEGGFTGAGDALARWKRSEILISPPVLITLQTLDREFETRAYGDAKENLNKNGRVQRAETSEIETPLRFCAEKLLEKSQTAGGAIPFIQLNPFVTVFPLRTETLPPATHTNCFVVGGREFVIIDPGSPFESEQKALAEHVDRVIEAGNAPREIIITHHHRDHVSGVKALRKHLHEKHSFDIPLAAHRLTDELLPAGLRAGRFIVDEEVIRLETGGGTLNLKALHTPGHAPGHLCFYDESRGFLLSGDNVVGAGSVLIAPPEGDMSEYLNALGRMKSLSNLRFLCGAHGAATPDAIGKIEEFIDHRLEREAQILEALKEGCKTPREIVERVYRDVAPDLHDLAELSVRAHLKKIEG